MEFPNEQNIDVEKVEELYGGNYDSRIVTARKNSSNRKLLGLRSLKVLVFKPLCTRTYTALKIRNFQEKIL
jgi:hypothetical protein